MKVYQPRGREFSLVIWFENMISKAIRSLQLIIHVEKLAVTCGEQGQF